MLTTWRIFARRGLANWPLLSILGLGVLVASTLLAAAPVYARVMSDLALTFRIQGQLDEAPATVVHLPESGLGTADGLALRDAVEQRIDDRVGWFRDVQFRYTVLADFWIEERPGDRPGLPFVGRLQSFVDYEDHVTINGGRLPVSAGPDGPVEVAISPESAATGSVDIGDTLVLRLVFDTCERDLPPPDGFPPPPVPCNGGAEVFASFPVEVVGIVEPIDDTSEFWPNRARTYFSPSRIYLETSAVLPLFITEETLLEDLGGQFPGYRPSTTWHVFPDPVVVNRTNFSRAKADLEALSADMEQLGGSALSPVRRTLEDFAAEASHKEAPLFILLLEISGVALFYVLLMSLVVVERQAGEIALLRGRGASTLQVVLVYMFDGLLVGIPVLLVAPLLAALVTSSLGLLPSFADVSGGETLPVRLPLTSFGMAAAGVGLALVTLALPVFFTARSGITEQKRAEARPGASFIQRYYLDLAFAAVALLLLWELNERGSVFSSESSVGLASDPLLLASPVLMMGAAAALLMRAVPLVLRVIARVATIGSGVAVAVGLWQVSRNPGQYTRLAVLLMMAVAVGTFAASYSSTTLRSYEDRARFEAGVEWRATGISPSALGADSVRADERFKEVEGLERWTAVSRISVLRGSAGTSTGAIQLLGVDPQVAGDMLWTRDDFADRPIDEMLGLLGGPGELGGRPLPPGSQSLKLWVNTQFARESTRMWARIRDENRRYGLVDLGVLDGEGWREVEGEIYGDRAFGLTGDITLVSILFNELIRSPLAVSGPLLVDDIYAVLSDGTETLIEDFENDFSWAVLPSAGATVDSFRRTDENPHDGNFAGQHTVPRVTGEGIRGFYLTGSGTPIPAIVSESFHAALGTSVGSVVLMNVEDDVVPVEVRDTYRLFPTLPASDGPSLVVNRDHLQAFLQLGNVRDVGGTNEIWVDLEDGADVTELVRFVRTPGLGLSRIVSLDAALVEIEANPLIAAGGSGILFVSFAVLLLLVTVALLVSLWVAIKRRRAEFAVLRAMGLARSQVLAQLVCEYSVVAIVGLGAGAYVGLVVGGQMLGFLNVTEQGNRVEPDFVLQTDWLAVLAGGGTVLAGFAGALLLAVFVLSRTSDAAALRRE